MNKTLRDAFENEMSAARDFYSQSKLDKSFSHLERAHVLGQSYVIPHTRTHIKMLVIGIRRGDLKEVFGQLFRIPGGIIASAIGKVPIGNTGGANIKLTATPPIPDDLKKFLQADE